MRLCDIGERIQEVMESYEVELKGETYQGEFTRCYDDVDDSPACLDVLLLLLLFYCDRVPGSRAQHVT